MRRLFHLSGGRSARRHRGFRRYKESIYGLHSTFEALESRALLAADVTAAFVVTGDWDSGFQAQLTLENHETTAFSPWRLEFDMAGEISSIWNATIASHSGDHYTIVGAHWNAALAANASVQFGFVAAPGGSPQPPANYVLNGMPLGESSAVPLISIGDARLSEGNSGIAAAVFTVSLSEPATETVSIAYATADGTATAGSDYQATGGTLAIDPGQTAATVTVPILGDADFESDETLFLDLSQPEGAVLSQSRGTGTIANDDTPPEPEPTGDFQFRVISNWGSGFTGQITVHNSGSQPLENWQLEFDLPASIGSIWNAEIESRAGDHYVVRHASYNSAIPAGGSIAFGFVASPGGAVAAPANYVLRGEGGSSPVNRAPVAVADLAFGTPGLEILIDVLANDYDPDDDAIALIATTQAAHGSVAIEDDAIRYTPQPGFTGSDSFTYEIQDARGATAVGTVTVTLAEVSQSADQIFAPYVDMTLYPVYDLVAAAQQTGLRQFTLAFVVADAQGQPAWGGFTEYALGTEYDAQMRQQIAGVRALGGDVIVSFGGAANRELAEVITDVVELQAAYQRVIDAYGLTQIDFDVEGAAVAHRESIDRRNRAIAGLQQDAAAAGRTLEVSYTLPVLPSGLTPDGVYVLESALARGVNLGLVNIMAMDYGDSAAPNPDGRMGDYAIEAATSLFGQLQALYGSTKTEDELWAMVGVTPMIGLNDVVSEVFDQQEARELLAFAQAKGIGRISFWSLNRDQQNAAGEITHVDLKSSSILQDPFEFTQIFLPFMD